MSALTVSPERQAQLDTDLAAMRHTAGMLLAEGRKLIRLHRVGPNGACSCPKGGSCRGGGKHPVASDWPNAALSMADVETLLADPIPPNLGMLTGAASGVWVLDLDGQPGLDWLERMQREHGTDWHATRIARTGSGGYHLWFTVSDGDSIPNSARKIAPGVDVRGDGGQVVLPGSRSAKGAYTWVETSAPATAGADQ